MSDDDYSSLSELASDADDVSMVGQDSDYEATMKPRSRRKTKKAKNTGYIITNALKPPRATTYTSQALFDQIVSGDIDLDPEYQRDVVWPEAKQVGLLDSIFRNFYIPPVIFSVIAHEDGSESKICIDGKQRLTSIYRFMLGLIYHRDRISGEKYWYKDSPTPETGKKKKRNILPEKYRRLFANKQIVCVEYSDINDKDEREIFQRVQLGMALTPAEKMAVVKTPRADFIRELQTRFFKDESRGLGSLDWDRSRGTDFRCLATIIWCLDRYAISPAHLANTGSISQLESFLSDLAPLPSSFRSNVRATFEVYESLVCDEDKNISGVFRMSAAEFGGTAANCKVSPIEFICITLLVYVWAGKLGKRSLAKAIEDMRRNVRQEHVDIRLNTKVGKTMIGFLKNLRPENYQQLDGDLKTKGKGKKRKRVHEEDEDDTPLPPDNPKPPLSKTLKMQVDTTASTPASTSLSPAPSTPNPTNANPPATQTISKPRLATLRALRQQHQSQTQIPSREGTGHEE